MANSLISRSLVLSLAAVIACQTVGFSASAHARSGSPSTPVVIPTIFGRDCSLVIRVTNNLKERKVRRWTKRVLVDRGYEVKDEDTPISDAEFSFRVVYQAFDNKISAQLTYAEAPTPDKVVPFYREEKIPGGLVNWFSKKRVKMLIEEVHQCVVIPAGTTPHDETESEVVGKPQSGAVKAQQKGKPKSIDSQDDEKDENGYYKNHEYVKHDFRKEYEQEYEQEFEQEDESEEDDSPLTAN
ncbi:MAG: hypothetical protein JNL01_04720 [Bdellovibrionales bacterium]|nr:hypothetical protein [Bdellovibrionales bacterium]